MILKMKRWGTVYQTNRKRGNNMTKINQAEYELLKCLDNKWKWIARDGDGTLWIYEERPEVFEDTQTWDDLKDSCVCLENNLFHFIQWEDESLYSIDELIEKYEEHEFYDYVGWEHHKKKKSEVKNIEWLKREIHKELESWHGVEGGIDGDGINEIMLLINQLDEPEVLSHKWISENVEYAYFDMLDGSGRLSSATAIIKPKKLQNLLVPKQEEITEEQAWEVIRGKYGDEVLQNNIDYVESQGYVVIEKPTVPQFVADWHVQNKYYLLGAKFERIADSEDKRVVDWYRQCSGRHNNKLSNAQETIALMDLVGYEVEEEQRYYLKIGNLYLAEPLGDMTSDIVRMTRDKGVAYQFTDEKSIATHLDKFEGTEAVKVEELEE